MICTNGPTVTVVPFSLAEKMSRTRSRHFCATSLALVSVFLSHGTQENSQVITSSFPFIFLLLAIFISVQFLGLSSAFHHCLPLFLSVCVLSLHCSLLLPLSPTSPPVPGDGQLTPGIRSRRMHGGRADASPAASVVSFPPCCRASFPWCSLPKGIPTRHNGQLTRVNNILLRASLQQRHRRGEKGRRSANIVQRCLVEENPATMHKAKSDASLLVL